VRGKEKTDLYGRIFVAKVNAAKAWGIAPSDVQHSLSFSGQSELPPEQPQAA